MVYRTLLRHAALAQQPMNPMVAVLYDLSIFLPYLWQASTYNLLWWGKMFMVEASLTHCSSAFASL